ncbi:GNAT family N-acetyltransferase [Actinospica sp.]|uniref:GNAT family N-acetyltransferase n=1 Tax=Actinospica sp. TaxID=1872142 RepID=UPI002BEE29F5|nr:GNAT family N-acetyltransferase [Actinospica sp.]HWG23344.1 GNAT family N-acetyltransferase [Actinospica sp.]
MHSQHSRSITFRPSVEADLDRILPFVQRDAACPLTADRYQSYLADGQYSHARTWIAADAAGAVLAVAVWWAMPGSAEPAALDAVYVHESLGTGAERVALAANLLAAGHQAFADEFGQAEPPEHHVFIPSDWRDQPDVLNALTWRREAVERAGLGTMLERLRFEWTTADGLIEPVTDLEFRPEPDDAVFVDLFTRALTGSLDTTSTREAAHIGAAEQARQDLVHLRDKMLGERSWWRVAVNRDGELVGFGVPSRNPVLPVVGYLGVLPEHRGRGYVHAILAEITRILVAEADATTIRADTDLVNKPMADAFLLVGYRNHARRLVFSAS